jgi:hypothetical protein
MRAWRILSLIDLHFDGAQAPPADCKQDPVLLRDFVPSFGPETLRRFPANRE